jgi:HAD superfamily hydrolase (TIGR01509 family)
VVFDIDGTLTDNMPLHMQAFEIFAARHGLPPLSPEQAARLHGKRNRDILPVLFGGPLSEERLHALSDEKEAVYRELSRGRLRPLEGLLELLDALERRRLPVALATAAPAANVPHTLGELGLAARLTRVVRADEVPRGKPHPDVFLAAAALIGVPAGECLAFEDAPMGLLAARAAGMTCIAVTTGFSAAEFAAHGALPDEAVADYAEFLRGPGGVVIAAPE